MGDSARQLAGKASSMPCACAGFLLFLLFVLSSGGVRRRLLQGHKVAPCSLSLSKDLRDRNIFASKSTSSGQTAVGSVLLFLRPQKP